MWHVEAAEGDVSSSSVSEFDSVEELSLVDRYSQLRIESLGAFAVSVRGPLDPAAAVLDGHGQQAVHEEPADA
jgi:hypothetical protein